MSICIRKNFIKKFSKNCRPKTSSGHFCLQRIKAQLLLENEILEARHIRQVIANLSKFVQMNMLISTESFLKKILWKYLILKFAWPLCFPAEIFCITKDKKLSETSTKIAAWKLVPGPCVCKEFGMTYTRKWNFWSMLFTLDL